MPKTAAATTTAMDALPTTNVAATSPAVNRLVIQVELQFENVNFDPSDLRAALDTQYGTVASLTDGAERPMGPFRFRISA